MTTSKTPPAWRRAFLRELARSGSVASAARACGLDPSYPYQLRRRNAAFAASWERAVEAARARLQVEVSQVGRALDPLSSPPQRGGAGGGGARRRCASAPSASVTPTQPSPERGRGFPGANSPEAQAYGGAQIKARSRLILRPDEIIRSSKTGHCRIVRVRQGRWSAKVEAAFLAELTATANVSAAARAAGVTLQCVYMRRKLWPAFKAEWDAAVAEGFARIETLLVCAATTTLDPEPLPERAYEAPQMSMDQAIKIWLTHRAGGPGANKQRLGGVARREPDIEEVRAEMLRKVAAMERAEIASNTQV